MLEVGIENAHLGNSSVWYYRKPIGVHKVQTMVKSIFADAQIPGNYTYHSLRSTGAANLFAAGVPEALIQKRTGHRSLDSLRLCETRGNDDKQTSAVSKILAGNALDFSSEVKKLNTSLDSVGETIDEDALSSDFLDEFFGLNSSFDNPCPSLNSVG